MADIKVDRTDEPEGRGRRRSNWPLWLLVPLGIFGLVAITQLGDRPALPVDADRAATSQGRADSTVVVYQDRTWSNAGAAAVTYPDAEMVHVGASESGIVLYRHQSQPWDGGGGGSVTRNPVYMKTGDNTYLPLRPVGADAE